jgi:hypothetical protein
MNHFSKNFLRTQKPIKREMRTREICNPVLLFLFKEPSANYSVILPNQKISTN